MNETISEHIRLGIAVCLTASFMSTVLVLLILSIDFFSNFQYKTGHSIGQAVNGTITELNGQIVGAPVLYRVCKENGDSFESLTIKLKDTDGVMRTYNNPDVLLDHKGSLLYCSAIGDGSGVYVVNLEEVDR